MFRSLVLRPFSAIGKLLSRLSIRQQLVCLLVSAAIGFGLAYSGDVVFAAAGFLQFLLVVVAITLRIDRLLTILREQLQAIHSGDLTQDLAPGDMVSLQTVGVDITVLSQQLSRVVAQIRSEAQYISMSGIESSRHAQALSQRTESQAANLKQTSAGLANLLETVRVNGEHVRSADHRAATVKEEAGDVQQTVQVSVDCLQRLEQRSRRMADIVTVIDGIAFQTNILALNAAVEAARAGESGRGFAVVATEVRTLAQRSASAAAEVKELIQGSINEVDAGVRTVMNSREALGRVVKGVTEVSEQLAEVAHSTSEQRVALEEIAAAVVMLDEITQQNAQMSDSTVTSADALSERAARLSDGVASLRLRQGCADEAKAMALRAAAYIDAQGIHTAVNAFHDPKGQFRDRDLYIVVADRDDYFRAFGADPQKAGKRRQEALPGDNQAAIRDASWQAVDAGGGWIEFHAPHPVTKQLVEKMGYVAPANKGAYAVQCSVNRGDGRGASLW